MFYIFYFDLRFGIIEAFHLEEARRPSHASLVFQSAQSVSNVLHGESVVKFSIKQTYVKAKNISLQQTDYQVASKKSTLITQKLPHTTINHFIHTNFKYISRYALGRSEDSQLILEGGRRASDSVTMMVVLATGWCRCWASCRFFLGLANGWAWVLLIGLGCFTLHCFCFYFYFQLPFAFNNSLPTSGRVL